MTLPDDDRLGIGGQAGAAADGPVTGEGLSFSGLTGFVGGGTAGSDLLPPGSRLGDVAIIRLIAAGGMGRVYEGLQGMPCRTVAVKLIHPGVLSPTAARRFEHEAHILGRLNHPGIAKIHSVGIQDVAGAALPYFVMEFVEDARSITHHATDRALTTRQRVELFREACRAVAHGHLKGIVHRDLKPGNILVDGSGQPKVIDFGVARSTAGDVALTTMHTEAGHIVGTLQYMSPEQFDGDVDEIDMRSDVYSLGIVLYELLAGRPPYAIARQPVYEAARIVRETEPTSVSAVNPRLPRDLATIVAKCLEKDRSRRYASAGELEADLGRFLRAEPIVARPPQLLDGLVKLARRHRFAAAAAAGIAASLLLALAGISLFAVRAERQRRLAVAEQARADTATRAAGEHLYVANLRAFQTAIQTGNVGLAREAYRENAAIAGDPRPLELRVLGTGLDEAIAVLKPSQGVIRDVAFSPRGDFLVALSSDTGFPRDPVGPRMSAFLSSAGFPQDMARREAHLFQVTDGGGARPLPGCDDPWVRRWLAGRAIADPGKPESDPAIVVSDDGRCVAERIPEAIRISAGETGAEIATLPVGRERVQDMIFTPDARRLLIRSASGHAALWDPHTGRPLDVVCESGWRESIEASVFSPDSRHLALLVNEMSAPDRREIRIHDARDGGRVGVVHVPAGIGFLDTLLVFSPDGSALATSSRENEVIVWRVADGTVAGRLAGHDGFVTAVAFSADGARIASGTQSGTIRLWDRDTHSLTGRRVGHEAAINALAFRPDGRTLASGSRDGTLRVWTLAEDGSLARCASPAEPTIVRFRPDGGQIAIAMQDSGLVELWDPLAIERVGVLDHGPLVVRDVVYSADGSRLATAASGAADVGEVRVWDVQTRTSLATLGDHVGGARTVAFSPDGSRLLTTAGVSRVILWDWAGGTRLVEEKVALHARFRSGYASNATAVFGDAGRRVVSGSPDARDAITGEAVATMPRIGMVTSSAAQPGGRLVARGTAIGTVSIDDCRSGTRVAESVGHASSVLDVAFTPDGTRLVTASADGTARVWETATGSAVHVLEGHEGAVEKVLLTPDGRRIVTGSADGTVRIWDASSGRELCALPGSRDMPRGLALDPAGTRLVTIAAGTVRIWGVSNAEIIAARHPVAARDGAAPRAHRETPGDPRDPAD